MHTAEWLEAGAPDETASRYFLDRASQTMVATRKQGRLALAGLLLLAGPVAGLPMAALRHSALIEMARWE